MLSRVAAGAAGLAAVAASAAAAASAATEVDVSPDEVFVPIDMSKFSLDHHLLHSALAGDDKLERYELHLSSKDKRSVIAKARLGSKACGHPHIVHGGAIASLLDDAFGASMFASKMGGFTANLTINYRRPLPAGRDVVVSATIDRVEVSTSSGAKKVFLVGKVTDEADASVVYTEGSALFIVKAVPSHMRPAGGASDSSALDEQLTRVDAVAAATLATAAAAAAAAGTAQKELL